MIDVLWNIVCCIGLVAFALVGICICVYLIFGIIKLIQFFKEDA